jgi:DNA-binding MarR family transcriptional regulator
LNKLDKFKLCGTLKTTITGKLVYLVLIELADANGEAIVPQRKISSALGIAKKTVSRNLLRLRDGGYISIQAQYHSDDGGRAANKYIIR